MAALNPEQRQVKFLKYTKDEDEPGKTNKFGNPGIHDPRYAMGPSLLSKYSCMVQPLLPVTLSSVGSYFNCRINLNKIPFDKFVLRGNNRSQKQ